MRHCGASQYHDGSLRERTRGARKTRGRKIQSRKDKAAYVARKGTE
jgi:hypothetical protein